MKRIMGLGGEGRTSPRLGRAITLGNGSGGRSAANLPRFAIYDAETTNNSVKTTRCRNPLCRLVRCSLVIRFRF